MDERVLAFLEKLIADGFLTGDEVLSDDVLASMQDRLSLGDELGAVAVLQQAGIIAPKVADSGRRLGGAPVKETEPPPLVNTWQDPTTGQWFYMVPQVDSKGVLINLRPMPFTPPKADAPDDIFVGYDYEAVPGWMAPVFQKPDGSIYTKQPTQKAITEASTEPTAFEREQWEYKKQADVAAQAEATRKSTYQIQKDLYDREAAAREEVLRRQEASTNQWLAAQRDNEEQRRQDAYRWQEERYQQLMPGKTAENWINTWRYQNTPGLRPRPPSGIGSWTQSGQIGFAPNQTAAERKGLTGWVAPGQVGPDKGAMWTNQGRQTIMSDPNYPGGRPETDAEFNYRTKTLLLRAAEEGGWINKGGSSDPYVASALAEWHKYNPEPGGKREVAAFRDWELGIGKRPPTFLRPEWESQRGGFLDWQMEYANRKGPPGPELPTWGYGLGAPTQQRGGKTYLDVAALRRSKGVGLSPLSAQRAQGMAPSELAGYKGLVQAGKRDWGDFEDNMLKMWRASRPGQQAQRRPRSY